ncbi:MAG: hypothetical protein ABI869_04180 [Actinomycetota bacterium]
MLAVVKPSPLRLWGFLLTVLGGALVAFGSIGNWATITLGGTTENAVPSNGIDLWQGKVTGVLGVLIILAILALRFVRPEYRKIVAVSITVAALVGAGIAAWCLGSLESVIHGTGVDALAKHLAQVSGITEAQARQQVLLQMQKKGIAVQAQPGLKMVFVGGLIAVAGGLVDLAWVRRKRVAGNEIDPDTLPVDTPTAAPDA